LQRSTNKAPSFQGELVQAKEKHKHLENHLNEMRMKELQWANDIGTLRSSLAVEQSRLKAKSNRIEELLKELEEKKTDISLSHSAKQVKQNWLYQQQKVLSESYKNIYRYL
jgi:chromosome segregation ATPase